ncbi:DsbA family protein [Pseudomonas sp. B392_1p]|uniref:DsbA family protein n=1 Tax=Pseudomonas sp. B392_1p TaxID=3457507 RepID=UPI003FD30FE2
MAKAWEAASGAGLDLDKARSDMQSPGIDAALKLDMQDVKAMGVRETPTFFVNGQSLSQFSPQALRKLVRDEIASAKK